MIDVFVVRDRKTEYRAYQAMGYVDEGDREPVLASECHIGTVVQHWGLPNRTPFIVIGHRDDGNVMCAFEDGRTMTLLGDAWFGVCLHPTADRISACSAAFNRIVEAEKETAAIWSR